MPGNEDLKQIDPKTATMPTVLKIPDKEGRRESQLAIKLKNIRGNARVRGEKVQRRIVTIDKLSQQLESSQAPENSGELKSLPEAIKDLEDLEGQDIASNEQFVEQAARDIRVIKRGTEELRKLADEEAELTSRIWEARFNIDELSFDSGWRRLIALTKGPKRRGLLRQREAEKERFTRLHGGSPSEQLDKIKVLPNDFLSSISVQTDNEATQKASEVRSDFADFYKEAVKGSLPGQIEEKCIQDYIRPSLVRTLNLSKGSVSAEQVNQAEAEIRKIIRLKPSSKESERMLNQIFRPPFNLNGDAYSLCDNLIQSDPADLLKRVIGQIGMESFHEYMSCLKAESHHINEIRLNHIFSEKGEVPFKKAVLEVDKAGAVESLRVWKVIQNSPHTREVFGEYLDKIDAQFYEQIIGDALTDGGRFMIPGLDEYPTPDTIMVLLLLSAERPTDHHIHYVNSVLRKFAKSDQWEDMLQTTLDKYPSFSQVIPTLKYYQEEPTMDADPVVLRFAHPQLVGQVKTMMADKTTVQRLPDVARNFSLNIFSPEEISQKLAEWEVLTNQEAEDLQSAYRAIESLGPGGEQGRLRLQSAILGQAKGVFSGNVLGDGERTRNFHRVQVHRYLEVARNFLRFPNDPILGEITFGSSNLFELDFITPKDIVSFYQNAPRIFTNPELRGIKELVLAHNKVLIKDDSDVILIDQLVRRYGNKAHGLIKQYLECVEKGVLQPGNPVDQAVVLKFLGEFKIVTPKTIEGFKKAVESHTEEIFLSELRALAPKLISRLDLSDSERNSPYYGDLMQHVYHNNSGEWTNPESNNSCRDRNTDLDQFKIDDRYTIDLFSQSQVTAKEPVKQEVVNALKERVLSVARRAERVDFDPTKLQVGVTEALDVTLALAGSKLRGVEVEALTTPEEKLFVLLVDSIYGLKSTDQDTLKDLTISYQFAFFENVREYITGTSDRVSQANNPEYALLCELNTFYADKLKEVSRHLIQSAWANPKIARLMEGYFQSMFQRETRNRQQQQLGKHRLDQLGASPGFVNQVGKLLEARSGKSYSPEQVKRAVHLYEAMTEGADEDRILDRDKLQEQKAGLDYPKQKTREELAQAFHGQLRAQRARTMKAMEDLTGHVIDPRDLHLGEINVEEWAIAQQQIAQGNYNEQQFASYTGQKLVDIFADEVAMTEGELSKFEAESGKSRERIYAYFTKTHESANARMVGGVCVAGDNPLNNSSYNMWDMPNYFQLVFQDPDNSACLGLVLLHHFTSSDGKKVLTASVNPSSTYLLSIDEAAFFKGTMEVLEGFAKGNDFDMILTSQNKQIRTNRTGGVFERSLTARIDSEGRTFRFDQPVPFSYQPSYSMRDMDVVWSKAS